MNADGKEKVAGLVALALVALAVTGLPRAALAGTESAAPAPVTAPSTAPVDLSGIWGGRFVFSLSNDPPSRPVQQKLFDNLDRDKDPLIACQPPGIPRLDNLAFLLEIVQTPKVVYFLYEYDHYVRRIYMNQKHPANYIPTWLGNSVGHWEGRTLVIDTVGFKGGGGSWLDMSGHQHSDALHTIERFTLSEDGQSLKQEVTIDDPKMYTKPWESVPSVHKRRDDLKVLEYICEPSAGGQYADEPDGAPDTKKN